MFTSPLNCFNGWCIMDFELSKKRAEELKANMFKYLWNGDFFMHQLHLNHEGLDDLERHMLEKALERNGEPKATTLYYLSADIEMYQKLVDDYVEIDEDDAHDTYLQQHALCYSQGLAY